MLMKRMDMSARNSKIVAGSMKDVQFEVVWRRRRTVGASYDQEAAPQRLSLPRFRGDAALLRGFPPPAARLQLFLTDQTCQRSLPAKIGIESATASSASRSKCSPGSASSSPVFNPNGGPRPPGCSPAPARRLRRAYGKL